MATKNAETEAESDAVDDGLASEMFDVVEATREDGVNAIVKEITEAPRQAKIAVTVELPTGRTFTQKFEKPEKDDARSYDFVKWVNHNGYSLEQYKKLEGGEVLVRKNGDWKLVQESPGRLERFVPFGLLVNAFRVNLLVGGMVMWPLTGAMIIYCEATETDWTGENEDRDYEVAPAIFIYIMGMVLWLFFLALIVVPPVMEASPPPL